MELKINGQKVSAELVDGRYVYTFTPDQDVDSVALASTCIGETELKRIQLEQGGVMTPFVVPEVIPPDLSGSFKHINDLLLEMTDTENSNLWANIRLNARGMIETYHNETAMVEILKSTRGVATSFEDKLRQQAAIFETSVDGLRNTVRDHAGSLTRLAQSVDGFEALAEDVAGRSFRTQLPTIIEDRVFKDQLNTFIRQSGDNISLALQNKGAELMAALNLSSDGPTLKGDRINLDGATFTKDFTAEIAKIIEMDAGRITTGKLSGKLIEADTITGQHLKMDKAFFDSMASKTIETEDGKVKNLFATTVQSVKVTAQQLSGAVLTALNNAMTVDLNNGQMLYHTGQAAAKRVIEGLPTQFLKFETGKWGGYPTTVTVIGSNRFGTESTDDDGFVGARFWNGGLLNADVAEIVGDECRFVSAAASDNGNTGGWMMTTTDQLIIQPRRNSDRINSVLYIGDIMLQFDDRLRSLKDIIRTFNTSIKKLGGTYYTSAEMLDNE